jgi:hypothetical protein
VSGFAYDASGQRVRKVYEHSGLIEERTYLGGYEVYRKYVGTDIATILFFRGDISVRARSRLSGHSRKSNV